MSTARLPIARIEVMVRIGAIVGLIRLIGEHNGAGSYQQHCESHCRALAWCGSIIACFIQRNIEFINWFDQAQGNTRRATGSFGEWIN